jgi:hypothetical protein
VLSSGGVITIETMAGAAEMTLEAWAALDDDEPGELVDGARGRRGDDLRPRSRRLLVHVRAERLGRAA